MLWCVNAGALDGLGYRIVYRVLIGTHDHDDRAVVQSLQPGIFCDLILIGKVVGKALTLLVNEALQTVLDGIGLAFGRLYDNDAVGLDVHERYAHGIGLRVVGLESEKLMQHLGDDLVLALLTAEHDRERAVQIIVPCVGDRLGIEPFKLLGAQTIRL